MARTLGIGIIGAGNISATYLRLAPLFKGIEIRAIADINKTAATARASEYRNLRRALSMACFPVTISISSST